MFLIISFRRLGSDAAAAAADDDYREWIDYHIVAFHPLFFSFYATKTPTLSGLVVIACPWQLLLLATKFLTPVLITHSQTLTLTHKHTNSSMAFTLIIVHNIIVLCLVMVQNDEDHFRERDTSIVISISRENNKKRGKRPKFTKEIIKKTEPKRQREIV